MRKIIIVFLALWISVLASAQNWSLTGNSGTTSNFLGTTDNLPLRFRTNNVETMVLDENGNLTTYKGIKSKFLHLTERGTIASIKNLAPSNGLELASTNDLIFLTNSGARRMFLKGDGDLLLGGGSNEELSGIGTGNGTNNLIFKTNGSSSNAPQEKMRLDFNGYLGLGTASPATKLHVYGTNPILFIEGDNTSYYSGIRIKSQAGDGLIYNYGINGYGGISMVTNAPNGLIGLVASPYVGTYTASNDPTLITHRIMGAYNQSVNVFQVEVNSSSAGGVYYPTALMAVSNTGAMSVGSYISHSSAKLDVSSTTQGFLAPRMTTTEKNAISYPATGLMVYDNTLNSYNYYNGTSWQGMGGMTQWTMTGSDLSYTSGSVGIGTSAPVTGYKLAVKDGIITEKVKVKLQSAGWPDYVFEKGFQLPTLKEVEKFINEHKHLPGIPTAKEVGAEGLNLGENQAKLLQKIEELTLYIIQQQKEIEEMKKEIKEMKK